MNTIDSSVATEKASQGTVGVERNSAACFHGLKVQKHTDNPPRPRFALVCQIGKGGFGTVYRALCERGCAVAIKSVSSNCELLSLEIRNLEYLSQFSHPNIIAYFGHIFESGRCQLVFELGDEGFYSFVNRVTSVLKSGHINNIAYQLLEMLSFLSSVNVCHADFRFMNMVHCKANDRIKLVDFGVSSMESDDEYDDPLSDLSGFAMEVGRLQLDAKYAGVNEDDCDQWDKAVLEFICPVDIDHFVRQESNWLAGLSNAFKWMIAQSLTGGLDVRKEAVEMRSELVPRNPLTEL